MGYYTYITGDASITPPIPESSWPTEYNPKTADDYFEFNHVDGDEDVRIVNGEITVVGKTAGYTQVVLRYEGSVKAYDFDERLDSLIKWVKSQGAAVDGTFYGDGEESQDFWRVSIENNVPSTEHGVIVYPSERLESIAVRGRAKFNHGNIIPRPDGLHIQCGGPPQCPECQADRDWLTKELYG